MDASDEQLVERCQNELPYRTESFEILLRRYEATVYRTCLRYLGSSHDAEEASQDAFLRVYHGLPKFSGKSSFRTWLYRIVANVCATVYAKRKRRREQRQTYMDQTRREAKESWSEPANELSGPIADALAKLSPDDRQVLVLRHVSGLSVPEIADAIDVKLSAAKMRVSRAEQRLREHYDTLIADQKDVTRGSAADDFLQEL